MVFCGLFKKLILGLIMNIDNGLLAKLIYGAWYSLEVWEEYVSYLKEKKLIISNTFGTMDDKALNFIQLLC